MVCSDCYSMLWPDQSVAANRRPAGQLDGSENLAATVATDRAFPAGGARPHSHAMKKRLLNLVFAICFSILCWKWCQLGLSVYRTSLAAATQEGANFPDRLFIFISIAWSVLLVVILFGAIWSLQQVFKPSKIGLRL